MQNTNDTQALYLAAHDKPWQTLLSESQISTKALLSKLGLADHPLVSQSDYGFPVRAPKAFIDKIKPNDPYDPLLLQVLPQNAEGLHVQGYTAEPLEEQDYTPVPGLIHKYRSRVLLVTTQACAIHCRYCFRRHFPYNEHQRSSKERSEAFDYIARHNEVNEVILSGGDPLSLSDTYLAGLLKDLDRLSNVTRIRIHTRYLPALPQRVTAKLCRLLASLHSSVVLVSHCNHPNELAEDTAYAYDQLKKAGVILLNQSVLLKSINDDATILAQLSERLIEQSVLPYYLFVLDKVAGAAHFDLTRDRAVEIHQKLAAILPGFLVPRLAEENPGEPSKALIR